MRVVLWLTVMVVCGCSAAADEAAGVASRLDEQIHAHRQAEVGFIVLDGDDQAAQGAVVRIEQVAHAFRIGFVLPADGPPLPQGFDPDTPGWRVFNAASLAARTGWRDLQPGGPADFEGRRVRAALTEAARAGLATRWGPLVPASVLDLPEWAVPLRGADLHRVLSAYLDRVVSTYGHAVTGLDLAGHPADDRLDFAMTRLLQQEADALAPGTPMYLAFSPALGGDAARAALRRAESAAKRFVGHQGLSLGGRVEPRGADALADALGRWRTLGLPVVVEPLEIGGVDAPGAAANLRRVMTLLFAEPSVDGVYFAGPTAQTASDPNAALFDEKGRPTDAGRVLDELFAQTWWTDTRVTAGPRGRASARVFCGRHRVTVDLPGGERFATALWVAPGDGGPRTVVLQPVGDARHPEGLKTEAESQTDAGVER